MVDEIERKELNKIWQQNLDKAETLGFFLKAIRKTEHLSVQGMIKKIAELEGGSQGTRLDVNIYRWENNKFIPRNKTLETYKKLVPEDNQEQFSTLVDTARKTLREKPSERKLPQLDSKHIIKDLDNAETLGVFLKGIRKLEQLSLIKMGVRIAKLEKRNKDYADTTIQRWENDKFMPQETILETYSKILQEKIKENILPEGMEDKFQKLIDKTPERRPVGGQYKIKPDEVPKEKTKSQWTDQVKQQDRNSSRKKH